MKIKCENCKQISDVGDIKNRSKVKCPGCGRKGTVIYLEVRNGYDAILMM
jgi:DNA-directed RNA polymerase subunit RPC12/RpoP